MNRREALITGMLAPGIAGIGASGVYAAPSDHDPAVTGPLNPNPSRPPAPQLEPGATPVRLACQMDEACLTYPATEDIGKVFERIRTHGYSATSFQSRLEPRNIWLDAPDSVIRETVAAAREHDIEIFDIMTWSNLLHPDRSLRERYIAYVCDTIECADRLGCRSVTLITGTSADDPATPWDPGTWSAATWRRTVEVLRKILNNTAGASASIGVEAVMRTNINSAVANQQIIEDVGHERCKVCLDPMNMTTVQNYYRSTELVDACFGLMGEDIITCHAKDTLIMRQNYVNIVEVPPGKGVFDYHRYLVHMSRMEWPRTLMLEHFDDDDYPSAKAYIEKTACRAGVHIYGS